MRFDADKFFCNEFLPDFWEINKPQFVWGLKRGLQSGSVRLYEGRKNSLVDYGRDLEDKRSGF